MRVGWSTQSVAHLEVSYFILVEKNQYKIRIGKKFRYYKICAMERAISQKNRLLKVDSYWDEDAVILTHFCGVEEISKPFEYELTLLPNRGVLSKEVIGQFVTITLQNTQGVRYFNGVVRKFSYISNQQMPHTYKIIIVPQFYGFSWQENYRIFQNLSVIDIFRRLCKEYGLSHYDLSHLHYQYPPIEYCVQYNETDLDFLNRLFSQAGLFYCFTHEKDRHVMHLLDHSYFAPSHHEKIAYTHAQSQPQESICFFTMSAALKQALSNNMQKGEGESNVKEFIAGMQFDLNDIDNRQLTGDYFITLVKHYAHDLSHKVDQYNVDQLAKNYHNKFTVISNKKIYTSARLHYQHKISGVDTAFITSVRNCDVHGHRHVEVKCQFHWDRFGQHNENSSKWIRVAQDLTGHGFGAQFLPRKGDEVLVIYRNGDPNEPLVIGSAYNGEHRLPFNDKDMQFSSGIKTQTAGSQDKNAGHYILFKDKTNAEEFNLKAEQQLTIRAENNEKVVVGKNQFIHVGANQTTRIGKEAVLSSNGRFEIDGGSSKIIMTPDKIEIRGIKIRVI